MAAAAPNLSRIVNSNANWFINSVLLPNNGLQFQPKIINQSFTVDPIDPTGPFSAAAYNQFFDSYVALHGVIMVQAAGDSGPIVDPGMAYNVITVGAYPSATSASSTAGQLAKPDLVTPLRTGDLFTSFAAPTVSGIAALLVQGAGGTGPGVDPRTVKALLINGAVKPAGWTHSATVPLDRQLGAGVVNAYNSYHNLTAGQHTANANTLTTNLGAAHLPVSLPLTVGLAGWNLATITTDTTHDVVDHYLIDLSAAAGNTTLTATLTWLRANNAALTSEYLASNENTTTFTTPLNTINNLDLFLYNADTQSLVDLSNSSIDNVEHLYTLNLAPGKYDLEVLKHGGNTGTADVFSQDETYAVAWNVTGFTAVPEPGSIALMGVGMFAMLRRGRRRT